MTTPNGDLASLSEDLGQRWHVWYVPRACGKPGITWHAREWSNKNLDYTLHANHPGQLRERIVEWEKRHPDLRA